MNAVAKAHRSVSKYASTFPDVAVSTKVEFSVSNKDATAVMKTLQDATSKVEVGVRQGKKFFSTSFAVELDGKTSEVSELLESLNCIVK